MYGIVRCTVSSGVRYSQVVYDSQVYVIVHDTGIRDIVCSTITFLAIRIESCLWTSGVPVQSLGTAMSILSVNV